MSKNNQSFDFLLEIFVEEIPARLVNELGLQVEKSFINNLSKNTIDYSDIKTF